MRELEGIRNVTEHRASRIASTLDLDTHFVRCEIVTVVGGEPLVRWALGSEAVEAAVLRSEEEGRR